MLERNSLFVTLQASTLTSLVHNLVRVCMYVVYAHRVTTNQATIKRPLFDKRKKNFCCKIITEMIYLSK